MRRRSAETKPRPKPAAATGIHTSNDPASIVRYYSESAGDYRAWSPRLNMHFGYWRWGFNPLRLEPMLDEMTEQVLQRAEVPDAPEGTCLLDLGCGMGAPARYTAKRHPQVRVLGLTLVPLQVHEARRLSVEEGVEDQVRLSVADYGRAPLETGAFDIAYAIESACHAPGYSKRRFVREAARLLRPGGRLVLADGFLKGTGPMNPFLAWCYGKVCANWALETFAEIDSFVRCLEEEGFEQIEVEDISWRLAPSVLHVPWVTLKFLWRELRTERLRMSRVRWGHLLACVLSPIVGMARWRYGYFLVSARRARGHAGRSRGREGTARRAADRTF